MTLRKKLVAVVLAVLIGAFIGTEWFQIKQSEMVVSGCLQLAAAEVPSSSLTELCGKQQQVLSAAALARWSHWLLVAALLSVGLPVLIERCLRRPLAKVQHHVRLMGLGSWGLGTWKCAIPAENLRSNSTCGEVTELADSLRQLGDRLDSSLAQIELSSRRSTMALLATRTERKLDLMREYLSAVRQMVESARHHRQLPPRQVIDNLRFVEREILALEKSLDAEFQCELQRKPNPRLGSSSAVTFRADPETGHFDRDPQPAAGQPA